MSETEIETSGAPEFRWAEKAWALREEITKAIHGDEGDRPGEKELRSILCGLAPLMINAGKRLIELSTGEDPLIPYEHVEPIPEIWRGEGDYSGKGFRVRIVAVDEPVECGYLEIGMPKIQLMEGSYEE